VRQAWPVEQTDPDPHPWWPVALVLLVLVYGYVLGYWAGTEGQPDCPQEDSCVVDYRDGAWHIEEVTP
jgi:hypothetical protein